MSGSDPSRALLHVDTHLGANVLMLTSLSVHEAISQPFDARLTLVSPRGDIHPDDMLHHPMTAMLQHAGEPVRFFHGIVQSFSAEGAIEGRGLSVYQARLVSRFWFLSQTKDSRVFQNQSVTDIVRAICQEAGTPAPSFKLQQPHKPREYITQFNETDLDFVTRLLQEEGAYYFFEHSRADHSMVIADNNGAFRALDGPPLRFDSAADADDVLTSWQRGQGTTHGQMRLIDYHPTTPRKRLDEQQKTVLRSGGSSGRDVFHWPALSHDPAVVRAMARHRLEADEAAVSLRAGKGRSRALVAAPASHSTKTRSKAERARNSACRASPMKRGTRISSAATAAAVATATALSLSRSKYHGANPSRWSARACTGCMPPW